jgi:hypothetical protein
MSTRHFGVKTTQQDTLARCAASCAILAVYGWLLLGLRLALWHDAILFPLTVGAIAYLVDSLRPRVVVLATLLAAAFALQLAYVWEVGFGGRNHVFAGVFALSDAGEYYWDAERVLHGVPMDTGGARRPIFSALLAGVLRVLGNNVRAAHVFTLIAWAVSGALAACEVRRTHGFRAGTFVLIVFAMFARRYVGFVQSEGVGGPLGARTWQRR